MKKLLMLIAFLLIAPSAFAVPALVSGQFVDLHADADPACAGTNTSSQTTCVFPAFSSNVTSGNGIFLIYQVCASTGCVFSGTETVSFATPQGGSAVECKQFYPGSAQQKVGIVWIPITSSGTGVITGSATNNVFGWQGFAVEMSGVATSSACDSAAGFIAAYNPSTTTISEAISGTTTECNEVIFGSITNTAGSASGTSGTTIIASVVAYGGTYFYKVGSATTSGLAETVNGTQASDFYVVYAAVFKSSDGSCGGGGGSSPRGTLMGVLP